MRQPARCRTQYVEHEGGHVEVAQHALDELETIEALVRQGEQPEITGRQLLRMFDAERRGTRIVARIRSELRRRRLVTEPDFNAVWVDVPIRVKALDKDAASRRPGEPISAEPELGEEETDPIQRIGGLPAANQSVVSVPPGTSLNHAMTLMMLHDFSQLPIIHNDRDCKGAVSWQSIAKRTALGKQCDTVNDCMKGAEVVSWNVGLLDAIPKIVSNEFVIVQGADRRFQGIVTVADLSLQFRALSEPFLLLGQIENSLRVLIGRSFGIDEIKNAKNPNDDSREVNHIADLTFGEYVRLLESSTSWGKLKVSFERAPFVKALIEVRDLRNDIMHFDPDPLGDGALKRLRTFAAFLEQIIA